eukprot:Hpha_TRINITY_DN16645_c3_g5::TRINITY_DN16645_c3_g5_i1::g.179755::m.179755
MVCERYLVTDPDGCHHAAGTLTPLAGDVFGWCEGESLRLVCCGEVVPFKGPGGAPRFVFISEHHARPPQCGSHAAALNSPPSSSWSSSPRSDPSSVAPLAFPPAPITAAGAAFTPPPPPITAAAAARAAPSPPPLPAGSLPPEEARELLTIASEEAFVAYDSRLPTEGWVFEEEEMSPEEATEEGILFLQIARKVTESQQYEAEAERAEAELRKRMTERYCRWVSTNRKRATALVHQWRLRARDALRKADELATELTEQRRKSRREQAKMLLRRRAGAAAAETDSPSNTSDAFSLAAGGLKKGAALVKSLPSPPPQARDYGVAAPSQGAAAEQSQHALDSAVAADGGVKPTLRTAGLRHAVARAGATAGLVQSVDSLRRNAARIANEAVLRPDDPPDALRDALAPSARDAAVAAVTASGCAYGVARTASATSASSLPFTRHLGPAASGAFAAYNASSALLKWARGDATDSEVGRSVSKVAYGLLTGVGAAAAAVGVGPGAATAVSVGSVVLDVTGGTDKACDAVFGRDERGIFADMARCYALVLDTWPEATDDEVRARCLVLEHLLDAPQDGISRWGAKAEDLNMVHTARDKLLSLRAECRKVDAAASGTEL